MAEAIFGLIGVIVGGVLTGGVEWFLKRREERQTARALARAIYAELVEMKSKCGYCAERSDWTLVDEPFDLPIVWKDNELGLARLLTWDQWVGLQAIRASQLGMRMLAGLAATDPALNESHLPAVTDAAIAAIDGALPAFERLSGQDVADGQRVTPLLAWPEGHGQAVVSREKAQVLDGRDGCEVGHVGAVEARGGIDRQTIGVEAEDVRRASVGLLGAEAEPDCDDERAESVFGGSDGVCQTFGGPSREIAEACGKLAALVPLDGASLAGQTTERPREGCPRSGEPAAG